MSQPIVPAVPTPSRSLALACVLAALAVHGRASADAVEPEPEECPPGTYARTDHGGPRCEPRFCGRDVSPAVAPVDCDEGARCSDALVRFVAPQPIDVRRPGFPTVSAFEGDCPCTRETCVRADVCVPDASPVERCTGSTPPRAAPRGPPPSTHSGCAPCRVRGAHEPHAAAGLFASVLVAHATARARARARRREEAR